MKSFSILHVSTHAEAEYQEPLEIVDERYKMTMHHWAEITLRIERGMDWEKEGPGLLKRLRKAAELDEEVASGE